MRRKCSSPDRTSVQLVGPRLAGPEDAVAALRLSAPEEPEERIVALVCDEDHRVVLALDFDGAPIAGIPGLVDLVATAAADRPLGLVLGIFRPGGAPALDGEGEAAAAAAGETCRRSGITLLDTIVISGDRWRSVPRADQGV